MAKKDKIYYEIVRGYDDPSGKEFIALYGPLIGIHKATSSNKYDPEYEFVQVINRKPVQAFTKDEILVLDKVL
jgi:hypothetical protein